jgi:hypothetical protein
MRKNERTLDPKFLGIGRIKQSVQMKRYIRAAMNFTHWSELEKKSNRMRKKWERKMKYYDKLFSPNFK